MTPGAAVATEAARRVWARGAVSGSGPDEVAAAAERVCAQLRVGLARWIGAEGYRALLHRALDRERAAHPALDSLPSLQGDQQAVAAAGRTPNAAEVTAATTALVATLIELLSGIVGEEMAVQLVEQTATLTGPRASGVETKGRRDG